MTLVHAPEIPGLPAPRRGKVRDVFDLGDRVLLVATDRLSAFDVVMPTPIPDKGRILTQMSLFWFDRLRAICPNHILDATDAGLQAVSANEWRALSGRSVIARKATPLKIECVARGYITGSMFREYAQGHTAGLPSGLLDGSKLPEPIFTPSTKADEGHDENITYAQAENIVGTELAAQSRDWTLALFREASLHAASVGLILADTKFEFGLTDDGLIWIDEALTPDSSRYWEASQWQPGQAQPSFDKQYVRDFLIDSGWNREPPGPALPESVVQKTCEKYRAAFRRIVGRELDVDAL